MIVYEDGQIYGSIGGGCAEAEVMRGNAEIYRYRKMYGKNGGYDKGCQRRRCDGLRRHHGSFN